MSEEEWYTLGEDRLSEWRDLNKRYGWDLSSNEADAFEYAWELAGREMGIVA